MTLGATSAATCQACPQGTYMTGTGAAQCDDCPQGFTTPGTGSTAVTDCFIVLPVRLEFFHASLEGRVVALRWATQQERNNSFFVLQRSSDGVDFQTIAKINGHGTTDQRQLYQAYDPFPQRGPNYYRLRQVDFDGTQHLSPIISVATDFEADLVLYPNPVSSGQFNVANLDGKVERIEAYDQAGRLVAQVSYPETHIAVVDCAAWPAGTYTLIVTTETATHRKVLVRR